jgi:hypothetical protein
MPRLSAGADAAVEISNAGHYPPLIIGAPHTKAIGATGMPVDYPLLSRDSTTLKTL